MNESWIPYGLSGEYWARLSEHARADYWLVRPMPKAGYEVDCSLDYLESWLDSTRQDMLAAGGAFELIPDFQRGHVWSEMQQSRYVESLMRGTAPTRILFNCPGWLNETNPDSDIAPHTFQCIDGLQRLTALRRFVAGEVSVFGGRRVDTFAGSPFAHKRFRIQTCIYEFGMRADLLRFYLDLNAGGTVHTEQELSRVRNLLDHALEARPGSQARAPMRGG